MPTSDFIHNARTALAALSPGMKEYAGDAADGSARWAASRELWLTPSVLDGFNPEDYFLLPAELRKDLAARAERFRATAAGLAGREATPEEIVRAADELLAVLRPVTDYFSKPEGLAVMKALWAGPVPDFVLGFDYTLGNDWTGDPAVWVWVIIPDDTDVESDVFRNFDRRFGDHVWKVLGFIGSERVPYVRLRLVSEIGAPPEESVR